MLFLGLWGFLGLVGSLFSGQKGGGGLFLCGLGFLYYTGFIWASRFYLGREGFGLLGLFRLDRTMAKL